MNYWIIFITGLSIGGLTCLVVQGGLLASVLASQEKERGRSNKFYSVSSFVLAKLFGYTLLGLLLGTLGDVVSLSTSTQAFLQIFAGIYMLLVALNLFNIHPVFRYVVIQPPYFLTRKVRLLSKSPDFFAPVLLGLSTVFLPCGTTIAMEALAISTSSPLLGALTMFIFTLGTLPLFLLVGFVANIFSNKFNNYFYKIAGLALIYMASISIHGSLVLLDSPITLSSFATPFKAIAELVINPANNPNKIKHVAGARMENGVQVINMTAFSDGYQPAIIQVKSGIPVRLNITTQGGLGCTSTFTIPKYNIVKNLHQNEPAQVEFTPEKPGKVNFSCSMGMYSGIIEVI